MHNTSDSHTHISINHNSDFSGVAYITYHPPGHQPMSWAVDGPSLAAGLIRVNPEASRMAGPMLTTPPPLDVATRAVAHVTACRITGKAIAAVEQLWVPAPPKAGG